MKKKGLSKGIFGWFYNFQKQINRYAHIQSYFPLPFVFKPTYVNIWKSVGLNEWLLGYIYCSNNEPMDVAYNI